MELFDKQNNLYYVNHESFLFSLCNPLKKIESGSIIFFSNKGIKVLNEIGVAFAHSEVNEESIFIQRLINQSKKFLNAGSWKILLESEGLTENMNKERKVRIFKAGKSKS